MARKTNNEETKVSSLKDIFEAVDALNTDASLLSEENSLSIVNDWIDTGSYALNAIFSGSVYRGVPVGRVTGFSGPSGAGSCMKASRTMR